MAFGVIICKTACVSMFSFADGLALVLSSLLSSHRGKSSFAVGGGYRNRLQTIHIIKDKQFDQAFECPECRRKGTSDVWISGLDMWKVLSFRDI